MAKPSDLQERLQARSDDAIAKWERDVRALHKRLLGWEPESFNRPHPNVELAVLPSAAGESATYIGREPIYIGVVSPEDAERIIMVHVQRDRAAFEQARLQTEQAKIATDLIASGWTFRRVADALELAPSRIVQLVGPGVTTRQRVQP